MGQPGAVPESACEPLGAVVPVDFAGEPALLSLHEATVRTITTATANRIERDRREGAGVMAGSRSRAATP
jgi:hypothetical protein